MTTVKVAYNEQWMERRAYIETVLGLQLVCDESGRAADFTDEPSETIYRKIQFFDHH